MTEPRPHPEVVNGQPSVLIVGYGHVGRLVGRYFTQGDYVEADRRRMRVGDDCLSEVSISHHWHVDHYMADGQEYDLGFICVPTPEGEDGRCDTSIVREAFATWGGAARYWCVRSTVEPGTTESLGPNVCFSPEFYGETIGHPFASNQAEIFAVIGGPPEVRRAFVEAWSLVTNSYSKFYQTDARTAELTKLMENCWIATKVSFVNEFYSLAEAAGVDWHELRELWLADTRVSRSHTYVYPRNRGWAGKCIPKDTASLAAWARSIGEPAYLIEAVREVNARLRGQGGKV
jgi:UDPglucose 6-dehydrogenase